MEDCKLIQFNYERVILMNVYSTAGAPVLLATIPYSQFTASTTKYTTLLSVLTRNVKARTFIITNTTDQPLSSLSMFMYDSTTDNPSTKTMATTFSNPVANGVIVDTSENKPLLASHVDSVMIGTGMGATLPTTGNVKIYMVEMI